MKKLTFKQWYAIIVLVMLCGCTTENKEKVVEIGEYVYIDQYKCLHVNRSCIKLIFSEEGERPNYMVTRVPTIELDYFERTCASCVTDNIYKDLREIIVSNNEEERDSVSLD